MLQRIRRQEDGHPPVPAIALTAFASEEHRQKAIQAGFQEHLPKPVQPDRFLEVVSGMVKG
jgi:CheY-like chemotaxis protein